MNKESKVDLCFFITGRTIPVDHGYDLYSSISKEIPKYHGHQDIGLKLIKGRYIGDGLLDSRRHMIPFKAISKVSIYCSKDKSIIDPLFAKMNFCLFSRNKLKY
jgi:hypothetical protein